MVTMSQQHRPVPTSAQETAPEAAAAGSFPSSNPSQSPREPLSPRPQVRPGSAWSFPAATTQQWDNGLTVVRVPMPGQRIISAELALDAPLGFEPVGREGVASLVVRSLDEGTVDHPGAALAEAMESIGASYSGSAGMASTIVGVDVPATRVDGALELFCEVVARSALDRADVARQLDLGQASLAQVAQRGPSLASLAAARAVWAPGAREALPTLGTMASLARSDAEAAHEFWQRWWRPRGGVFVVSGEGVESLDLSTFESWQGVEEVARWQVGGGVAGEPADSGVPGVPGEPGVAGEASVTDGPGVSRQPAAASARLRLDGPTVVLVDRPEAVQADVRAQLVTVGRGDQRWPALRVAAGALGGTFGSRLNTVLREEKGWSYGVGMGVSPLPDGGMATVSGAFRTEVAARAVAQMLEILTSGPDLSAGEVGAARDHMVGLAPLQYDSAGAVAHQVAVLVRAGLEPGWVDDYLAHLAAVEARAANDAWHELLAGGPWRIGISGPASELAGPLSELGLDVEVVTPDDLLRGEAA